MITLITTPGRTATQGAESKWSASDNSVDFVFQRADRNYTMTPSVVYSTGTTVKINLSTPVSGLSGILSKYIYLRDSVNRYTGTYQVLAVSGNSQFTILIPNYTSAIPGFVNLNGLYVDYLAEITVYPGDGGEVLNKMSITSSNAGEVRVNLSGLLKSYLDLTDRYNYDGVNKQDYDMDFYYRFKIVEYYTPTLIGGTYQIEIDNGFRVAKAARQIGDEFGQNMRKYMTYPYSTGSLMKFMNEHSPVYFDGFPFSLSFIYSEMSPDKRLIRRIKQYGVNMNDLSVDTTKYINNVYKPHVNRLTLNPTTLNASTKYLGVRLEETDENHPGGYADDPSAGSGTGVGGGNSGYAEPGYSS